MIRPLAEFSAHLSDTASLIGAVPLAKDLVFTGVTHSDKDVEAGDLFLAIPGARRVRYRLSSLSSCDSW